MAKPPVAWTLPARLDLLRTLEYLAQKAQAPQAAADLIDRLEEAAASLADSPERGRVVPELGWPKRELLVKGYRMV